MYEGRIETEMDSRGGKMKLTSFSPNGELGQGIESSDVDDGELNQERPTSLAFLSQTRAGMGAREHTERAMT